MAAILTRDAAHVRHVSGIVSDPQIGPIPVVPPETIPGAGHRGNFRLRPQVDVLGIGVVGALELYHGHQGGGAAVDVELDRSSGYRRCTREHRRCEEYVRKAPGGRQAVDDIVAASFEEDRAAVIGHLQVVIVGLAGFEDAGVEQNRHRPGGAVGQQDDRVIVGEAIADHIVNNFQGAGLAIGGGPQLRRQQYQARRQRELLDAATVGIDAE